MALAFLLTSCYSFTGGSIPPHLKTIFIESAEDNSGYGNPLIGDQLTLLLFDKFRSDGSLEVVEANGDASIFVKIKSIRDEPLTVGTDEYVSENKITLSCEAEYYDNTKRKSVWNKNFSSFGVYSIEDPQTGREEAIRIALDLAADDILIAVISGW